MVEKADEKIVLYAGQCQRCAAAGIKHNNFFVRSEIVVDGQIPTVGAEFAGICLDCETTGRAEKLGKIPHTYKGEWHKRDFFPQDEIRSPLLTT